MRDYDVVIIGGGPAGSSAAFILAQKGHSVLLLEQKAFPRFHIGESLLPYMSKLLENMNLLDKIEMHKFVTKWGAEFTDTEGDFSRVDFTKQGKGHIQYTFQVERSKFDQVLLDNAREAGTTVIEQANVTRPLLEGDRVIGVEYVVDKDLYRATARFVIDASGRVGKIANYFKLRKTNDRLKMVAFYKHFGNVSEDHNPGVRGDIQIGTHRDGWVWAIPVREDVISVGTVTRADTTKRMTPAEIFETYHRRVPRIMQRLEGATPLWDVRAEADFCYYSDQVTGPGYLLAGDAGCFADPIFSAGVFLAITTGQQAGRTIDAILQGHSSIEHAYAHYESFYKTGYDCYFRLIYGYYDFDYRFGRYLGSLPQGEINEMWVARMLGGDFWSRNNPFTRYLRSEQRWNTFAPFEFSYGCPIYPHEDMVIEQ